MTRNKILFIFAILVAGFSTINNPIIHAQDATDSADSIRDRVREKIEDVLKNPKAYLGTITDKTEDTLQIKNKRGEIEFISVNPEEASFVSIGKTSKAIKFTDVAIGDYIVAMGFLSNEAHTGSKNGNGVLDARRILVTEEAGATERQIFFGNIAKIEKRILTVATDAGEIQAEFPKTWKGPEIKELSENDRVALVVNEEEGKTLIRTIEIINKVEPPPFTPEEE